MPVMRYPLLFSALLLVEPSAYATAIAQNPKLITGPPTCKRCLIEASLVFSIPDDIKGAGGPLFIAHDTQNRYFFTTPWVNGKIFVHNERGIRVAEFGREGRGPGEWSVP